MSKAYIGLVAKPGGGKETFGKLLRNIFFKDSQSPPSIITNVFSDVLRKTLAHYGIDAPTTKDLQDLSDLVRARREDAIAFAMGNRLNDPENVSRFADIQFIDGVRKTYDADLVRSFSNNFLIYISADPQKRFERIKARGQRPGETEMTWEEFLVLDNRDSEKDIETLGANADFKIDNNGTLEEYEAQVKKFYEESLKPLFHKKEGPYF